jgi:HAMP domain-containing protein
LAQATKHLAQAVHQLAQAGSIQAAQRATDSHELLVNSAIALGIVAVLALLAGWLVAGRMLRPIRTITRTARRISSTSLHERLALAGPQDELKELGDTLDDDSKVRLTPNNISLPTRPMNCALHSLPSAISSRLRSTIRTRAMPNGAPPQKKCLPRTTNRRI